MALNGVRILLAEDNPTNQMVAVQMLESLGAEVRLAVDGIAALELAEREPFDVGLIDIEMPRLSGTDVIRRIRADDGPLGRMPLIALTAYVMREHREAIDAAGADGVIAKPILSIEQLGADVRRIMEERRADCTCTANGAANGHAPRPPCARTGEAAAVVDREVYDTLALSIGETAMRDLLGKVESDLSRVETMIRGSLDPCAPATLREATHVLVAVAGAIGARTLQEFSQCLNSAAHSADANAMVAHGRATLGEIEQVRRFVRERIRE